MRFLKVLFLIVGVSFFILACGGGGGGGSDGDGGDSNGDSLPSTPIFMAINDY